MDFVVLAASKKGQDYLFENLLHEFMANPEVSETTVYFEDSKAVMEVTLKKP